MITFEHNFVRGRLAAGNKIFSVWLNGPYINWDRWPLMYDWLMQPGLDVILTSYSPDNVVEEVCLDTLRRKSAFYICGAHAVIQFKLAFGEEIWYISANDWKPGDETVDWYNLNPP